MAEYTAVAKQTIPPGESVIFTATTIACPCGNVRHSDGTPMFVLKGYNKSTCGCAGRGTTDYGVSFGCNVALSTGADVAPINVSITVGGSVLPSSTMISTPAAVEQFNSISKTTSVPIWNGCCQTIAVTNNGTTNIDVQNAVIVIK